MIGRMTTTLTLWWVSVTWIAATMMFQPVMAFAPPSSTTSSVISSSSHVVVNRKNQLLYPSSSFGTTDSSLNIFGGGGKKNPGGGGNGVGADERPALKPIISDKRRKELGIPDGADEYDLGMALRNNTDDTISKIIAGSLIVVMIALLVAGIVIPATTDYGEGVCQPLLTGGRC